jgi:Protein of unknown function (DUF3592)
MAQRMRKKAEPNRGGMAFGRNLMVLGGVILVIGGYAAVRGVLTLGWPRTTATIMTADQLRQGPATSRGLRAESWNSFHVLYRYHVGDHDYVAAGVEPYDYGMQNSAGATKMYERYRINSTADVAYDPRDPAVAYLEPGPSSFSRVLVGIGSFMALVGLWVRRKAAQGIGTMNEEGATERIAKVTKEGDTI